MLQDLDRILNRYNQLQEELARPENSSDPTATIALLKEIKDLQLLVEKVKEYQTLHDQIEQARELMAEDDQEMRDLAAGDIRMLTERALGLEEEIKSLLLPTDPADEKNAILEIRAGTGGEEAALFAADLYRMYTKFAENRRWKIELVSLSEADAGGIKEVIVEVRGREAFGTLKWESGVHRVQRVPVTESQGRVHTSAATVAVLPEAEERDVQIRQDDLRIDIYRSSGRGGQHVNTTDSAVRISHIP